MNKLNKLVKRFLSVMLVGALLIGMGFTNRSGKANGFSRWMKATLDHV
jgi:hypothetical protein